MGDHLERTPERKDMGVTQPGWCWPTLPQPREQQPRAQEGGGVARRGVARTGREGQASAPWEGNSCWDSGAGCLPILPQLGARLSRSGADTRAAAVAAAAAVVAASGFGWTRWGLLLWAQEPRRAGTGAGAQEKFTFSGCEEPRGGSGCCQVSTRLATAPGATLSFTAPPTPITTLESRPTHPDSCPRAPTHGPADLSSGLPSPPSASLGPERLDPLRQALADEGLDSQALGSPEGAGTLDSEPLLGATATAPPCARPTGENEDEEQGGQREEECPICTEPYGPGEHRLAQLNCGHGLCSGCLHRLLDMAPSADLGRVRCPLCRQKTPMLEWEICRLQEELLLADGPQRPPPPTPPTPPRRGPGPWASLEHHYQLRFLAGPVGGRGCLPFLPCPPCLGTRLWALRERGPCARRLGLLGLLGLELLGLLLTFTPLVLLGLLFMLLDRSGH